MAKSYNRMHYLTQYDDRKQHFETPSELLSTKAEEQDRDGVYTHPGIKLVFQEISRVAQYGEGTSVFVKTPSLLCTLKIYRLTEKEYPLPFSTIKN